MTRRGRMGLVILGIAGFGLLWLAVLLAGWLGAVWLVLFVVACAALQRRAAIGPGSPGMLGRATVAEESDRSHRFARYDTMASMIQRAQWDGRYFERVLRPYLWALAEEVAQRRHGASAATPDQIRAALGDSTWELLHPGGAHAERTREETPTPAQLAAALSRIEAL